MDRPFIRLKRVLKMRTKDTLRLLVTLDFHIRRSGSFATRAANQDPQRVLLVNPAHIGDVVISTAILPILRAAYPSAELGFLTGSWAEKVVNGHPEIRHVHLIDGGKFNRGTTGALRKWGQHRKSTAAALRDVRAVNYDIAICLYTYHPDMLDFVWAAGIPRRIGFRTSMHAAYATDLVDLAAGPFLHQSVRQCALLKPLGIATELLELRRSTLPPSSLADVEEFRTLIGQSVKGWNAYRIIHMGAGAEFKELPLQFWREVAEKLSKKHLLLFTGHGSREANNAERVITGLPNCVNACDQLSWKGFVAAVRHAEVLYGVDSAAGHVAAAVGTRSITLMSGKEDLGRWRPDSPVSTIFTRPVPCSPCYRESGCAAMTCLHAATPEDLISLE